MPIFVLAKRLRSANQTQSERCERIFTRQRTRQRLRGEILVGIKYNQKCNGAESIMVQQCN